MSQHSAYYHREQSLASTIINMSQNFGIELSPITRYLFPKDDYKLLKYLNEDGQSIEPNWYMPVMPVIPMVLVNGSEEIDDVLNSFIPNYNPREIIVNIRRLLNGEEVVPMDPWYKGFKGSIVKSAKEGDYVVNGTIEEVDEQTFRITELPIGMWTQDYKQFLLSVTDGTPDAKDILIEDFRQNGDDATVDILVRLKQDKIMAIKQEGLLKKFELTRTISTSNMYLFDAEGKIKKYDNPEQILEEFFPLRLEYYERRKKHKLEILERLLLELKNRANYISAVLSGEIVFIKKKKADFMIELKQKGFTPLPGKGKSAVEDDYEYLLSMSIGDFTVQTFEKLLNEKEEKTREFEILKATPATSMWMTDLDELEKKLDELDSEEAEERKRSSQASKRIVEPETSNSSMEVEKLAEIAKPKGRGGGRKGATKAKKEDEEEEMSLQERLGAYNLGPSGDKSAVLETEEQPHVPAAAAGKNDVNSI